MAEFAFNNKVHTATKTSLFQVNYGRELRMGFDIRKKGKNEKAEEFAKEMKKRHEEARAALVKSQECYDLKLKGLSNKTTLVLSNTRELDRVPKTK